MVFVWTHLRIIKHVSFITPAPTFLLPSLVIKPGPVARSFSGNFHPAKSLSARRCDEIARALLPLTEASISRKKQWALGLSWLWLNDVSVRQLLRFWKCVFSWFEILNMPATESRVKVDCFQSQLTLLLETCDMGQMCLMFLYSIPEMWQCRRSYYMIIHHLYL